VVKSSLYFSDRRYKLVELLITLIIDELVNILIVAVEIFFINEVKIIDHNKNVVLLISEKNTVYQYLPIVF